MPDSANAKDPEFLVLSCMDYRHMDDLARELRQHPEINRDDAYDHVILAGASLGVTQQSQRAWGRTFWTHLDTAMTLHPTITKVWLVEHMLCGAYKVFLGNGTAVEHEEVLHSAMATLLKRGIEARARTRGWKLDVSCWIMKPDPRDPVLAAGEPEPPGRHWKLAPLPDLA